MMGREPSCILNHEAMRKKLTDKRMPAQDCPHCRWTIFPSRNADTLVSVLIDREKLAAILVSMDSIIAAFELDAQQPVDDVNNVLQFLTELSNT